MKKTSIVLKTGFLSKRKVTFRINSKGMENGDYLVPILAMKATRRGVSTEEERLEGVFLDISVSGNPLTNISKWPFF